MQRDAHQRKTSRSSAPAQASQAVDRTEVISSIAYALYEARGCVDGHALEDWLEAEARAGKGVAKARRTAASAALAG